MPGAVSKRLSDDVRAHLIAPRRGPGVCLECFNLTRGYDRCYACAAGDRRLAAIVPISYSVAGEHLHSALAAYKRDADPFVRRATRELAAILDRFLELHEQCVAAAAGVSDFELVTTVPSGDRGRDQNHPLCKIVGEMVATTGDRYERLLTRSKTEVSPRRVDRRRFEAVRALPGTAVLLVDDTWTTGASAQSAALALLEAGASRVSAVVIGRHLNPGWYDNKRRLEALRGGFDFSMCVLCGQTDAKLQAA